MNIDYYSDDVFSLPAGEIIAKAKEEGMIWALLSYLQQWCLNNSFAEKGTSLLFQVYRTLGCHMNCYLLREKYLVPKGVIVIQDQVGAAALGLKIGVSLNAIATSFVSPHAENLWVERNLILGEIKKEPTSIALWFELFGKYVEMEELLMAITTLFIIKMNAPATVATDGGLKERLDFAKIYGTSGSIWAFAAQGAFIFDVEKILKGDKTQEAIADSIGNLFANTLGIALKPNKLLEVMVWPII